MSFHSILPQHNTLVGRHLAKRWCVLAETRLAYLTELFETGRWRRFHSEIEFLENIQEAKEAVTRWRAMAAGEIGAPVQGAVLHEPHTAEPVQRQAAVSAMPAPVAPVAAMGEPVLIPIEKLLRRAPPRDFARRTAPLAEMSVTPDDLDWKTALDPVSIEERYPMLRAAM